MSFLNKWHWWLGDQHHIILVFEVSSVAVESSLTRQAESSLLNFCSSISEASPSYSLPNLRVRCQGKFSFPSAWDSLWKCQLGQLTFWVIPSALPSRLLQQTDTFFVSASLYEKLAGPGLQFWTQSGQGTWWSLCSWGLSDVRNSLLLKNTCRGWSGVAQHSLHIVLWIAFFQSPLLWETYYDMRWWILLAGEVHMPSHWHSQTRKLSEL